jgi:hypothetical protein
LTEFSNEGPPSTVAARQDSEMRETENASGDLQAAEERASEPASKTQCAHHFGYLSERSNREKIPEDCMVCEKMLDCMVRTAKKETDNSQ